MVRRDTNWGFATRHDARAFTPKNIAQQTTTAAHNAANIPSGEFHRAIVSTVALQALATMMLGAWRSTRAICSARMTPATTSQVGGPPKAARSPANNFEK